MSRTTKIQTKPKRKREKRTSVSPRSEEESSHSAADTLPVVQDVELVDELVHAVARLGDGAQVGHEAHVITLLQQTGTNRVRLSLLEFFFFSMNELLCVRI